MTRSDGEYISLGWYERDDVLTVIVRPALTLTIVVTLALTLILTLEPFRQLWP